MLVLSEDLKSCHKSKRKTRSVHYQQNTSADVYGPILSSIKDKIVLISQAALRFLMIGFNWCYLHERDEFCPVCGWMNSAETHIRKQKDLPIAPATHHTVCVHHSAVVVLNSRVCFILFLLSGHPSLCVLTSSVGHVAETKHSCVCDCCDCNCAWFSVCTFFIQITWTRRVHTVSSQLWQNGGCRRESKSLFVFNCNFWFVLFIWRQMKTPTIQKQMVPGEMRKDQLTDGHPHSLSQVWICVCVCVCSSIQLKLCSFFLLSFAHFILSIILSNILVSH